MNKASCYLYRLSSAILRWTKSYGNSVHRGYYYVTLYYFSLTSFEWTLPLVWLPMSARLSPTVATCIVVRWNIIAYNSSDVANYSRSSLYDAMYIPM